MCKFSHESMVQELWQFLLKKGTSVIVYSTFLLCLANYCFANRSNNLKMSLRLEKLNVLVENRAKIKEQPLLNSLDNRKSHRTLKFCPKHLTLISWEHMSNSCNFLLNGSSSINRYLRHLTRKFLLFSGTHNVLNIKDTSLSLFNLIFAAPTWLVIAKFHWITEEDNRNVILFYKFSSKFR